MLFLGLNPPYLLGADFELGGSGNHKILETHKTKYIIILQSNPILLHCAYQRKLVNIEKQKEILYVFRSYKSYY